MPTSTAPDHQPRLRTPRCSRTAAALLTLAAAAVTGCAASSAPAAAHQGIDRGVHRVPLTGVTVAAAPRHPLAPATRPPAGPVPHLRGPLVPTPAWTAPAHRPNILFITADDAAQDDMQYMPHVQELLAHQGVTFTDAIAPTPICVPARASLLTGQYTHNHGALTIDGPHGGAKAFNDQGTLPVWLQHAGYDTLFVGKYLNGNGEDSRGPRYVPPGWTDWQGSVDPTTYNFFNTEFNHQGNLTLYPHTYTTDLVSSMGVANIEAPQRHDKPWYMWVSFVAPHYGGPDDPDDPARVFRRASDPVKTTVPAPRDRNTFAHLGLPNTPDMFEKDTSDKAVAATHKVWSGIGRAMLREAHEQRVEALQAVDEAVGHQIDALRATGQLSNTVVVFSSDNGYTLGAHNVTGKLWHYRETMGIPVLMRGPGVPVGRRVATTITNPDIAATFAALAGAHPTRPVDGMNVMPWLTQPTRTRVVPIEAWQVHDGRRHAFVGTKAGPYTYVRLPNGAEELYDAVHDPWQLRNAAHNPAYRAPLHELRLLTARYRSCQGRGCPHLMYQAPTTPAAR